MHFSICSDEKSIRMSIYLTRSDDNNDIMTENMSKYLK